jgi:hypothetical protein
VGPSPGFFERGRFEVGSVFENMMAGGGRAALFAAQGVAGTYEGVAVTLIPMMGRKRESFQDERGVSWDVEKTFQVAKSEVASPAHGASLVCGGVSYVVLEADETVAEVWSLKCSRIEAQERRNNEQVMGR